MKIAVVWFQLKIVIDIVGGDKRNWDWSSVTIDLILYKLVMLMSGISHFCLLTIAIKQLLKKAYLYVFSNNENL